MRETRRDISYVTAANRTDYYSQHEYGSREELDADVREMLADGFYMKDKFENPAALWVTYELGLVGDKRKDKRFAPIIGDVTPAQAAAARRGGQASSTVDTKAGGAQLEALRRDIAVLRSESANLQSQLAASIQRTTREQETKAPAKSTPDVTPLQGKDDDARMRFYGVPVPDVAGYKAHMERAGGDGGRRYVLLSWIADDQSDGWGADVCYKVLPTFKPDGSLEGLRLETREGALKTVPATQAGLRELCQMIAARHPRLEPDPEPVVPKTFGQRFRHWLCDDGRRP